MPERPKHSEEDNIWLGNQLRMLRKRAGKSQRDVAGAIGDVRYQKYISDYENGIDHMPVSVFFALMEIFHAAPSEMLPPRLYGEELLMFEKLLQLNDEHRSMIGSLIQTMLQAEDKN